MFKLSQSQIRLIRLILQTADEQIKMKLLDFNNITFYFYCASGFANSFKAIASVENVFKIFLSHKENHKSSPSLKFFHILAYSTSIFNIFYWILLAYVSIIYSRVQTNQFSNVATNFKLDPQLDLKCGNHTQKCISSQISSFLVE